MKDSHLKWIFTEAIQNFLTNTHKNERIYDDTSFSFWMYKISCFNRAETDVHRQFLHKFSIGIKISNVSINSAIIGPNGGCCLVKCTFLLQHIIPKIGDNLKKPTKESFHVFIWWHRRKSCGEVWKWKGPRHNLRDNIGSVLRPRKQAAHRPKHTVLVCSTSSVRI